VSGRVVILVPRREGFADRDRLWAWTKRWWADHFPELPIIEGHHNEGLFNRSAALNLASRTADDGGAWDVALIIDADVICDPDHVRAAAKMAADLGRIVVPFQVRHNLNQRGSEAIMAGETGPWERFIAQNFYDQHSSVIAVPRTVWETVGGFDETFAGWGMEDTAFAIAAETLVGPLIHMEGEVWHLWHRHAPEGHVGTPSAVANRARGARYQAAKGNPDAIRKIQSEQSPPHVGLGIPRILHRVVPAEPNATAEAWWNAFGELHPDWLLRTHRDPLDPAEWPETARYWRRCRTGAQLAGLVRLEALWRFGGIYVDQDVQPFRSLEPLLALPAFAAWEDDRCVPDAVIGARPGHPAIRACLDLARRSLQKGPWESGPGVLTKILPNRPDVVLLPPGSFYPVHYQDDDRELAMAEFDPKAHPWTFALHHYWGSWLPAERRRVPA
jgi:hypothetical protein